MMHSSGKYTDQQPWRRGPGETHEDFVHRAEVYRRTGTWPKFGESEDDESFRMRCEAKLLESEARARRERRADRHSNISVAMGDAIEALRELGVVDPERAELGVLSHQIARAALLMAAVKLSDMDSGKLVNAAQKAVQIRQLVSGEATSIVGIAERDRQLVDIARELEALGDAESETVSSGVSRRFSGIGGPAS